MEDARQSGTFQGLSSTLLYFEDHKAYLFCRAGPHGGQDMQSSDGNIVYHTKYHNGSSAAQSIRDAKVEAKVPPMIADKLYAEFIETKMRRRSLEKLIQSTCRGQFDQRMNYLEL